MERYSASSEQYDANHALADVAAAQDSIARRVRTPWWYHPILGLNLAALILITSFVSSGAALLAAAVVSITVSLGLIKLYQHLTGLWIGPQDAGPRSRRLWIVYGVLVAFAMLSALSARAGVLVVPAWALWLVAAATLVTTVVLGRRIDALLREDIRASNAPAGNR